MNKYYFYKIGNNYTFDRVEALNLQKSTGYNIEKKYVVAEAQPPLEIVVELDKLGRTYI